MKMAMGPCNPPVGGTFNLPWSLAADPTGGVLNWNVLIYQLPFPGVAGDVLFSGDPNHDPGESYGGDVVRFDGQGNLIFYSDSPPFDALADTPGPPNPLLNNQAVVTEQGVEDVYDFANYVPLQGQPGWDPSNPSYLFISDIPEPGTLALAGLGFAGLALKAYRRRGQ
jgi:hypothetical protein